MIRLGDRAWIARGGKSLVFQHPADPRLLIKVVRPQPAKPWYKRRRRYGDFLLTLRQIKEYLALTVHAPEDLELIETVVGFAETDMGLGIVVEALRDRDGNLAPTVLRLEQQGRLDDTALARLDVFVSRVLDSPLVFNDFKPSNIVYAYDEASGADRFVLIDGIGPKTPLSISLISRAANRRNARRQIQRKLKTISLPSLAS